jgi:GTP-binding protein
MSREAFAGDIVAVSGIPEITIGETIADVDFPEALPILEIEEPTVKMTFNVNKSPFAGREGNFTTSRQIRERLYKELDNDVALRVEDNPDGGWEVSGRGELHLAIFLERLRREGYEIEVSQPQVIIKYVDGKKMIPYEEVFIEVPEEYSGIVIQKLGSRNSVLQKMHVKEGIAHIELIVPTRGLFGYRREFLSDTRGLGIMNTLFYQYMPQKNDFNDRERGSLVAFETGITRLYGLTNVQDRGQSFLRAGSPCL